MVGVRYFVLLVLVIFFKTTTSQSINNEYTQFFYPNGQLSSEGTLIDGKPDGLWKAYHVNGKLKSVGLRRDGILDSVWTFYDEQGLVRSKINYLQGKKSGYYYSFDVLNGLSDSAVSYLHKEELYLDNLRHGKSIVYYPDGIVTYETNYVEGKQDGIRREFDRNGVLTTLIYYKSGIEIDREAVNRTLNEKAIGVWKEFFPSGKLKKEMYYKDGKLHGLIKQFTLDGELLYAHRYIEGVLIDTLVEVEATIDIKEEFYNKRDSLGNFIKKSSGSYANNVPVGVHRTYDSLGRVNSSKLYDRNGILVGEGIVDIEGNRIGTWKYFYNTGDLRSKGEYRNNRRIGKWVYYYRNGYVEQQGFFNNGRPHGEWLWYHFNKNIRRIENYYYGKENGEMIEYDDKENIVVKGNYDRGLKSGSWYYNFGEHVEEGDYRDDLKEGEWTYTFSNGTVFFKGLFTQDKPDGKHLYYYKNGKLKSKEYYVFGLREKNWEYYDYYGSLLKILTFENNKLIKIDGTSVLSD